MTRIGSSTLLANQFISNLDRWLHNQPLLTVVDKHSDTSQETCQQKRDQLGQRRSTLVAFDDRQGHISEVPLDVPMDDPADGNPVEAVETRGRDRSGLVVESGPGPKGQATYWPPPAGLSPFGVVSMTATVKSSGFPELTATLCNWSGTVLSGPFIAPDRL